MNSREIVYSIYQKSGLTNAEYANLLGISRQALWDRINTMKARDMTVSVFSEMVSALGYSVFVSRESPEDAYLVGRSD